MILYVLVLLYQTPLLDNLFDVVLLNHTQIHQEISGISEKRYWFLNIEPAPKRVPDKVSKTKIFDVQ